MTTLEDHNASISTNTGPLHDVEEQIAVRGKMHLDRQDSSWSATVENNPENAASDFLQGFQRRLRFAWHSEFSVESERSPKAASLPTNESSPLMNAHKPIVQTTSKSWFEQAWRFYGEILDERPVLTKAVTCACLTFVGDFVGQCLEHESLEIDASKTFDLVRLFKFSAMGFCLQAPLTHYFYVVLDYYLPPTPDPWTLTTFWKLTLDQLLFGPSITFVVIVYLSIWEGLGWHGVQEEIKAQYWQTMIDNWKLWVPAQVMNMAYIPPAYRVLYCNVVFFIWSIYLSLTLNHTKG